MKNSTQEYPQKRTTTKRLAYRVDEVAELLGVSKSTIRRSIAAGQITAIKLAASTYVIPAPAVNALLGMDLAV